MTLEQPPGIIERLTRRDAEDLATTLDEQAVRELVDLYYATQGFRIRAAAQRRAANNSGSPARAFTYVEDQYRATEGAIRKILDAWTDGLPQAVWCKSQFGIGPVLAAGIVATFTSDYPTVGHWWRFAGLDPTISWQKGQKRPYSARAKVLCWKLADSFVKFSSRDECFYGKLYRERKAYELNRDAAGENAETAHRELSRIKDPATRAIYERGHLPPGRLDLRARRWTAKLFLAHYHEVLYKLRHGTPPPAPYAQAVLGHGHYIAPPYPPQLGAADDVSD